MNNEKVELLAHCSTPGCYSKPVFAGMCNTHYSQSAAMASSHIGPSQLEAKTRNATMAAEPRMPERRDFHDRRSKDQSMADKYPQYYKKIPDGMKEMDIYALCHVFKVDDAALSHALKKLVLPGTRTGGKTRYDDIKEARDTLTRWLELHRPY